MTARYRVNVFYSTFLPLAVEAESEGEALRKAGEAAPYEKFCDHEAKKLLFHLERFRELTDNFVPVEHACNSWRAMLDGLEEMEQDLHRHIHKENSWLFPQAVALEAARA